MQTAKEIADVLILREARSKEECKQRTFDNYRPSEVAETVSEAELHTLLSSTEPLGVSKGLLRCLKTRLKWMDEENSIREWALSKLTGDGWWINALAAMGKEQFGDKVTAPYLESLLRDRAKFIRQPFGDGPNEVRLAVFPGNSVSFESHEEQPLPLGEVV